jgi:hypothetical protein
MQMTRHKTESVYRRYAIRGSVTSVWRSSQRETARPPRRSDKQHSLHVSSALLNLQRRPCRRAHLAPMIHLLRGTRAATRGTPMPSRKVDELSTEVDDASLIVEELQIAPDKDTPGSWTNSTRRLNTLPTQSTNLRTRTRSAGLNSGVSGSGVSYCHARYRRALERTESPVDHVVGRTSRPCNTAGRLRRQKANDWPDMRRAVELSIQPPAEVRVMSRAQRLPPSCRASDHTPALRSSSPPFARSERSDR